MKDGVRREAPEAVRVTRVLSKNISSHAGVNETTRRGGVAKRVDPSSANALRSRHILYAAVVRMCSVLSRVLILSRHRRHLPAANNCLRLFYICNKIAAKPVSVMNIIPLTVINLFLSEENSVADDGTSTAPPHRTARLKRRC